MTARRISVLLLCMIIGVTAMSGCTEKSPSQNPVATIEMASGGIIKVELYPDKAPNTVNNFISLANSGYYDGVIFHRIIEGFMVQGGDPDGTGMGGPGYTVKAEFSNAGFTKNDISHKPGVISMARQGNPYNPPAAYDTAGSQFFICHGDASFLDGDYTAFGMVIEGMDEVNRLGTVATGAQDRPVQEEKMLKVTVDTFGVTYPEPEKLADR